MSAHEMGGTHAPSDAAHGSAAHPHGDGAGPVFQGALRTELDDVLARYPTKMAALLPALWIVQRERGWVSEEAMAEVAQLLDLTPAYVKGVVTFYTMYHQHPVGRYFIQVCTTSPCAACGAEDVVAALLRHTGCGELGATSPDGNYTVIEVECLGACGFTTPVMINDDFVESVTPERVPAILKELR
ncbi:MAG TPA: NAD(P)H-dependent oxidoreductase subunit E [Gemmatimonadaceae bacterium]|nr:NAD(P)H-dependent oxidoreductase subunit E [Gemmatimonadaceae bacterium]